MDSLPRDEVRVDLVKQAVRRRWPVLVVTGLILTVLAVAGVLIRPQPYVATGSVLLAPTIGNPLSPGSVNSKQITVAMETEASLAASTDVTRRAGAALHTTPLDPADITTVVPANSQVLQVSYASPDAVAAQRGAKALIDALLAYRQDRAEAIQKREVDSLHAQINKTRKDLLKASEAATSADARPGSVVQVQLLSNRLATLRDAVSTTETSLTSPGSVITPATAPPPRSLQLPLLIVLGALVVGVGIGFVIALWRERLDDRVRADAETAVAGVPVLTRLPVETDLQTLTVAQRTPDDPVQEAYRRLRAGTVLGTTRPTAVLVAPLADREPATGIAIDLALSLCAAGYRVSLVDTTTGDDVERRLGRRATWGVTEIIDGSRRFSEIGPDAAGLRAVSGGTRRRTAREAFVSDAFARLIDDLRREDDYVVVAGPPFPTPDGNGVALTADAVLLVIEEDDTTHEQVAEAARRADQLGAPLAGLVVRPGGAERGERAPGVPAEGGTDEDELTVAYPAS